jgi:hypothetical protein
MGVGMGLMVGAMLVGSASGKTAEAHAGAALAAATQVTLTVAAPATTAPVIAAPVLAPAGSSASELLVERVVPPALLVNRKLRRLQTAEVSPAMLQAAARVVHTYYAKPAGTEVHLHVGGQRVVAVIERHFHPEGGPVKPWGFHPGVSLFVPR